VLPFIVGLFPGSYFVDQKEVFMTEIFCSADQVKHIATDLNAGHRDAAMAGINKCTQDVVNHTDYPRVMQENAAKFLQGDAAATKAVESSFAGADKKEQSLWQTIKDAAHAKNPHGLCQLTIVDDQGGGHHAEIDGKHCK
jgi:hypothetical protein